LRRLTGVTQVLCLLAVFGISGTLSAADSTSFNPLTVTVNAHSESVPVGTIVIWQSPADPGENWLDCNGQATSGYPELAAIVGPTVPNYQGMFLRGYGSQSHAQINGSEIGYTSTTHSSGALGEVQGDASRRITGHVQVYHAGIADTTGTFTPTAKDNDFWGYGSHSQAYAGFNINTNLITPTDTENRPVNMAVRYLIRARP
jgi:hypothetical protein